MNYLFRGTHADTLASGRPIEPGEEIPEADVNVDDSHDAMLIKNGDLHKLEKTPSKAEREAAEKRDREAFEAQQAGAETNNEEESS